MKGYARRQPIRSWRHGWQNSAYRIDFIARDSNINLGLSRKLWLLNDKSVFYLIKRFGSETDISNVYSNDLTVVS